MGVDNTSALPLYFDALIAARRAGRVGRHVHLGYWDNPPSLDTPCPFGEFERAQALLTERIADLVPLRPGQSVLDVACGFGGTLAAIDARLSNMALTGLNIDRRQLELCLGAVTPGRNHMTLVEGDACALPFAQAAFDHILCVEAMFHFSSRRDFLARAARCLRVGGVLAVTDIFIDPTRNGLPWNSDVIVETIHRDYGPWPDFSASMSTLLNDARAAGLDPVHILDWSAATLPSYRIVAPAYRPGEQRPLSAGDIFRELHVAGSLTYHAMAFTRAD